MDTPDPGNTILTKRQWEILQSRMKGKTTEEIAMAIHTGRQNVIVLENRAKKKIERARNTLEILDRQNLREKLEIPAGTHLLVAVREVFDAADRAKIRLKSNLIELMDDLRKACEPAIENGMLMKPVSVHIYSDGNYNFRLTAP